MPKVLRAVLVLGVLLPHAASAAQRPVVVELFTSQGCSSCPPANAYLADLARDGEAVLPLGFHVTYWDRLGWKDPFSITAATERQARYGARFRDGSYTPEIVVDGSQAFVGSDRVQVGAAIRQASTEAAPAVTVTRRGDEIAVSVGAGTSAGAVVLVGFDHEHRTAIGRGENGGRTFVEANVVRSVREIGRWAGSAAVLRTPAPAGEDFAVLVEASDGRIVGAARLVGTP